MNTIDLRWSRYYDRIKDGKASKVIAVTMNPRLYKSQATLIRTHFPNITDYNVLEIGCGFGGLAECIGKCKNYTAVDNDVMLKLAIKTTKKNGVNWITFIDAKDFKSKLGKYDLLISNLCLSETPREYQDFVMEKVFPVCGNLFMLDGDKTGRLEKAINNNFKFVSIGKYSGDWRVREHVGKN